MKARELILVLCGCLAIAGGCKSDAGTKSVVAEGAVVEKLADGFKFTEGGAVDKEGNMFFTDIPNNRIHKWSIDGKLSVFMENTGAANGLYFDKAGQLVACEGGKGRIVVINPKGELKVAADKYNDRPFNSPNDLWIDPKGGVYFTDPRYGDRSNMPQEKECVYYVSPDGQKVVRVIDDLVRPNGIVGTTDGKKLYVADAGGDKTYVYTIKKDGTLADKKLFADEGADGMTIDNEGNIYITSVHRNAVEVYNSKGMAIESIKLAQQPANVCFAGKDRKTLFMMARTGLYSVPMRMKGMEGN